MSIQGGEPIIEIRDLYKDFRSLEVLKGLNLTVRKGETLVVIGRSGCGKSVLLKNIIGILKPESGSILIDGHDITAMKQRHLFRIVKRFGMVFQGSALFDSLTIAENIAFSLNQHTNTPSDVVADKIRKVLTVVDLKGIESKKPAELSGGMKKRVALARAVITDPEFILYDEPTTGLDPIMADAINELILKLHDTFEATSIAVTHDMVSAYKIADRIAMLYDGKIIATGTPQEIKESQDPIVQQFITGSAQGPITQRNSNNKNIANIKL